MATLCKTRLINSECWLLSYCTLEMTLTKKRINSCWVQGGALAEWSKALLMRENKQKSKKDPRIASRPGHIKKIVAGLNLSPLSRESSAPSTILLTHQHGPIIFKPFRTKRLDPGSFIVGVVAVVVVVADFV